ncbi:MAG: carbohydrate kinase family protein [Candidatus Nomurabacteria bacterium]|nr:carbohydrate kinase family protein [Candidatus Nomurabacteria bacterium]
MRIVCLGSALQDIFLLDRRGFHTVAIAGQSYFDRLDLGTKVDVGDISFSVGGGATNASVTFARSRFETIFWGCIGNDISGQAVVNTLNDEGVDVSYIDYLENQNTGCSVVLLAPSGARTILTYRGASGQFWTLKVADLKLMNPDWIYITTLSGDMDKLTEVLVKCQELGVKVMMNPGKKELANKAKLKRILSMIDVLLLNKDEAMQLTDGKSLDELLMNLRSLVPVCLISDGENGLVATDGKTKVRARLYEDRRPLDQTGAGDALGSGFLVRWARGRSLREAVLFGSANASSVVQAVGSKVGIISSGVRLHEMPIHETEL